MIKYFMIKKPKETKTNQFSYYDHMVIFIQGMVGTKL